MTTHLKLRAYEKDLEKQVHKAIEEKRQKDQMRYQQSKQAAVGELLIHIAHQWKESLSSLSSINMLQQVQLEEGYEYTADELSNTIEKSEKIIRFMSQTVETFCDFYQPSLKNENFFIKDALNKVLSIVEGTFKYEKIEVIIDANEKNMSYANVNEFTQVILSIMNNAKDVFFQRGIKNPKLRITIVDYALCISDNAGGIELNIIDEIFLPDRKSVV